MNGIGAMYPFLGIEDDAVAFQEHQVAVGDKDLAVSLDHDDDGLAGNIQIHDPLAVPGAVAAQDNFFP